ncbi:bromodomain testis-specific protein-like [Drosophila hydei]|uniref:Bromodomain testis-specific protein-like n=1 Tax=Drosophila hydei TaxID=7224 RepID=A0A6J1LV18_DROHY|nr:bromodomain testis-specific protein-like [Drosophila hydei]
MESHKPLKLKIKLPTRVQPEVMPQPGEAGLYTNKIHYLRKYLLDELVAKKFAMDFMEPVDTAALQVPNYYTIIKRPMDVGTIIKRVQNRYYHRVDDLICDFRLVISNCFTFNRPGDVVYRNCQKLEKFFHRVLNKMPKGEEKPSTKDPRSSGRQHGYEKASEIVQRQCQEHLAKLQAAVAKEDDQSICKYFNAKFDYLSQKVDRFYFKTIEEFRFEVTGIFKNFDNQIKAFHELFHKTCDQDPHQRYSNCHWSHELDASKAQEEAESHVKLDKRDITEVLFALKRAESSVDHCLKSYSRDKETRARGLIDAFDATANRLKQKLMRGRKVDKTREERRKEQQKYYSQMKEHTQAQAQEQVTQEEESPEREQSSHSSDDEHNESQLYVDNQPEPQDVEYQNFQPVEQIDEENVPTGATSSPMQPWQLPEDASPQTNPEEVNMEEQLDAAAAAPESAAVVDSTLWSDLQLSSSDASEEDESS